MKIREISDQMNLGLLMTIIQRYSRITWKLITKGRVFCTRPFVIL